MKLKTKKIIAREIIFFFLCIAASLLFFGGTFGYNWIRKTQVNKIEKHILQKTIMIESLLSNNNWIKSLLKEYVVTANNPEYNSNWQVINSKFPEFEGVNKTILQEYVATANNPEYKNDWEVINSKFPEFFSFNITTYSANIKRTFKVNNDIYDIPFDKAYYFLKRNPNAVEVKSFLLSQDTFNIEFNEISNFISKNPDAMPIYEFSRNDSINIHKCEISTLKTKKNSHEHKILLFDEQIFNSLVVLFVLLLILYPIRFIFLLIFWAVQVLKQK